MGGAGATVAAAAAAVGGWVAGVAVQMLRWPSDSSPSPEVGLLRPGAAMVLLVALVVLAVTPGVTSGVTSVMAPLRSPWMVHGVRRIGVWRWAPGLAWGGAWVLTWALAWALAWAWLAHDTMAWRTAQRLEQRLPVEWEGRSLTVQGVVAELTRRQGGGVQFLLEVESAWDASGRPIAGISTRVWLGWWSDPRAPQLEQAMAAPLEAGQRWQLPVVLKRPHGTYNPHAFDAQRWFLEQDIGASGHVQASQRARARLMGAEGSVWTSPEVWRTRLRDRIDAALPDPRLAGLVAGLTIGDQSSVDRQDWVLFRDTGVAHVLSISGLHITMFAAAAAPLAAALWSRWPRACLWVPAPVAAAVMAWCCALAYALLAGWGLPAQRTVAMLAVVTLARLAALSWPPLWVWVLAAAPVVVFDPWAVGQASFWLSFAAVGLLMMASPGATGHARPAGPDPAPDEPLWRRAVPVVARAVREQLVAAVGLAPLAAICFQQVSIVGVVANLVAVPWITLLLTPVSLAGLLWPPLWAAVPLLVEPLQAVLQGLAAVPGAVLSVPAARWPAWWVMGVLGAVCAVMPVPPRLRLCGAALMLPMMLPAPQPVPPGRFEVWGLDVGQGSAVLVRTQRHALLVDAGPAGFGGGADAGSRIVVPVLRGLGVRELDLLVVTHRDLDHAGGVGEVLRAMPVAALSGSLEPAHPLRREARRWQPCGKGVRWIWEGVVFQALHPLENLEGTPRAMLKPNTVSCVLRVEDAHGRSLLLAADIEAAQERDLLQDSAPLASTALVIPHHGSRTSSTEAFIEAVSPRWALAQAGYRNVYGHPSAEVMARYERAGVEAVVSPACGAWRWASWQEPRCWREEAPRHWHRQRESPRPHLTP